METFEKNLKILLSKHTYNEAADLLGVSTKTLFNYINKASNPRLKIVRRIDELIKEKFQENGHEEISMSQFIGTINNIQAKINVLARLTIKLYSIVDKKDIQEETDAFNRRVEAEVLNLRGERKK